MAAVRIQRWSAFTLDPSGGNPAGVVVTDEPLDVDTMQRVAAEVGYSETAFLVPAGPGRWRTRYFAPTTEVPFCGHATIATAVALAARDESLEELVLETPAGDVAVAIERSGEVLRAELTSPAADCQPLSEEDLDALLTLFGWDGDVLDDDLPPAVGHGGADHPVLALHDRETLARMAYDFDGLRRLMTDRGWTTVQIVWRQDDATFHARDPFPVGGVVEDPATGAAAAALGAYLRLRAALPLDGRFVVHQGEDMGRPSLLHVDASGVDGVRVAGTAVPITV